MENSTVFSGAASCFFQRHYPVHCQMIFDLQAIHDSYLPYMWEQKWFEYAQEHALIMPTDTTPLSTYPPFVKLIVISSQELASVDSEL